MLAIFFSLYPVKNPNFFKWPKSSSIKSNYCICFPRTTSENKQPWAWSGKTIQNLSSYPKRTTHSNVCLLVLASEVTAWSLPARDNQPSEARKQSCHTPTVDTFYSGVNTGAFFSCQSIPLPTSLKWTLLRFWEEHEGLFTPHIALRKQRKSIWEVSELEITSGKLTDIWGQKHKDDGWQVISRDRSEQRQSRASRYPLSLAVKHIHADVRVLWRFKKNKHEHNSHQGNWGGGGDCLNKPKFLLKAGNYNVQTQKFTPFTASVHQSMMNSSSSANKTKSTCICNKTSSHMYSANTEERDDGRTCNAPLFCLRLDLVERLVSTVESTAVVANWQTTQLNLSMRFHIQSSGGGINKHICIHTAAFVLWLDGCVSLLGWPQILWLCPVFSQIHSTAKWKTAFKTRCKWSSFKSNVNTVKVLVFKS